MTEEREKKFLRVLNNRQPDITLIFENVHDPHNISAVLRTADSIGIHEVYIIQNSQRSFSKLGKKSSSSAEKWIDVHNFTSVKECFDAVRIKYKYIASTKIGVDSKNIYDVDFTVPIALVFGNEHDGVSEEASLLSDFNFLIPQVGMISSLNISVACAVTLYEAFRQRSAKGFYNENRFGSAWIESRLEKWKMK